MKICALIIVISICLSNVNKIVGSEKQSWSEFLGEQRFYYGDEKIYSTYKKENDGFVYCAIESHYISYYKMTPKTFFIMQEKYKRHCEFYDFIRSMRKMDEYRRENKKDRRTLFIARKKQLKINKNNQNRYTTSRNWHEKQYRKAIFLGNR